MANKKVGVAVNRDEMGFSKKQRQVFDDLKENPMPTINDLADRYKISYQAVYNRIKQINKILDRRIK